LALEFEFMKRGPVPFPHHYCLGNLALIFLVSAVSVFGNGMFRLGSLGVDELFGVLIYVAMLAGFATLIFGTISYLFQRALHWCLKRHLRQRGWWMVLFLLPGSFLVGVEVYSKAAPVRADAVLTAGRLGALPPGASKLRYDSWSAIFTGAQFLYFEAPPEEIEVFLSDAPSLEGVEPVRFTKDRPLLPWPDGAGITDFPAERLEEFYQVQQGWPEWFRPTLRHGGRSYTIPSDDEGHNWGRVIIDDQRNLVFIEVVWS